MNDQIEQQRNHFNDISARYSEARSHPNHLLLKDLIWSNFFADKGYLAESCGRVLEPMCGMAEGYQILSRYLRQDLDYRGFDYSENMVEIARKLHRGLRIEWQDVTTFAAPAPEFDMIILIGGLHHVFSKSKEVISRLSGALKLGGHFLSFEPTHNSWLNRVIRNRIYTRNELFDSDTEQGFDFEELDAMFVDEGYRKVDQVFAGLSAYVLYYNPDAFPGLNLGGALGVRMTFSLDRLFWRTLIGRKFAFATITLWKRL